MVDRSILWIVVEFCRDAFGTVTALFCGEHGLDFHAEDSIAKQALLALSCTRFPFMKRRLVDF